MVPKFDSEGGGGCVSTVSATKYPVGSSAHKTGGVCRALDVSQRSRDAGQHSPSHDVTCSRPMGPAVQ